MTRQATDEEVRRFLEAYGVGFSLPAEGTVEFNNEVVKCADGMNDLAQATQAYVVEMLANQTT